MKWFLNILTLGAVLSAAVCCSDGEAFRVGIAEVNYRPEVGGDMVGNYRGEDYASRGVHDSLYARAVVIEDRRGNKAAILTVDICWMKKPTIDFMREYIAQNSDLRPENVMILATHTHSGPKSLLDAPHAGEYMSRAAGAVIEANARMVPARLYAGHSREDRISFNRRLRCVDGTTRMSWENLSAEYVEAPLGVTDPEVITILIERQGAPAAGIVNFGCHAATMTGNNWLYSADFPGYMVESLRKIYGGEFTPMFFNGACGNVTQVDYRRGFIDTFEECRRIGYMLGAAAAQAIGDQVAVTGGEVVVSRRAVPLKRIAISEPQRKWAEQVMERVARQGMPPLQADGIPDAQYAQDWLSLYEQQQCVDSLEVMVIRVGDVAFVGFPGEMFCEFGIRVKEGSAAKHTLVMGLANDNRKYFPTEESFLQGPEGFTPMITGYETTPGTTLYERGAGEKLVQSALEQLNELFARE